MPVYSPGASAGATNPSSAMATAVQRMAASGNPQAAALAASLAQNYGISGSGAQAKSSLSLMDQAKHAAGVAANYAAPVLHLLNRPSQAVLHTLQGFSGQGANILDPNVIGNALQSGGEALVGQQPDINLRQTVLGNDQGSNDLGMGLGGLPAGLIDTVGASALDPTTFLGGPAVKAGLKGLAAGGKALAATETGAAALSRATPIANKVLHPLQDAFITGAAPARDLGPQAGGQVMDALRSTGEAAAQTHNDTLNQLSALTKASGVSEDELHNVIAPAVASSHIAPLVESYTNAGNQAAADLTTKLGELLGNPEAKSSADRLPFQLSKDGAKAFKKDPEGVAAALGVTVKDMSRAVETGQLPKLANATPFVPKATSLDDFEGKLAGHLPEGKQFLNHNIIDLAAAKSDKAGLAAAKDQAVQKMADITDHTGQKVVLGEADKALADTRGFVGTELSDGTKAYVHPTVAKAMRDTTAVLNEDSTVKAYDTFLKKAGQLWKSQAVLSPHFHTQNIYGNLFMNAVAGMKPQDVVFYGQAARLQKIMQAASKSTKGFNAAIDEANLSAEDREAIAALRKEFIGGNTRTNSVAKIDKPIKTNATGRDKVKEIAGKANPLDPTSAVYSASRMLGSTIEDNSRMAHFLWALKKNGGDSAAARESVNKFLYDYHDLTPLERQKIMPVIPFYTYMRKNTPAQIALMAEHPGFYANYGKLQDNLQQHGPDDGTQYSPDKLGNGAFPIQLPGMKTTTLVSPSSPLYSAFGQLAPLGDAAALIPGSPTKNTVASPLQNLFQNLAQPVGGFGGGLAKFTAEEATGKNLATGGNIKPGAGNALNLLANTVLPTTGLIQRTAKHAQSGNGAALANDLAGTSTSQGGQNATDATLNQRLQTIQAALASLQASQGKLPTTAALRKAGKIRRATGTRKARAPSHRPHRKRA